MIEIIEAFLWIVPDTIRRRNGTTVVYDDDDGRRCGHALAT
jgi:hypothetical protein